MARYRFSIDLGVFLGTRLVTIPVGENGKPITGIFIPTGINGIEVVEDKRDEGKANHSKLRAFLSFMQRSYSNAFLTSCKNRLVAQGNAVTPYNVPAWQVCYSLAEEKRTNIRQALKQAVLRDHPEWSYMEDVKGNELAGAISRMMPFQIGDSYLVEEQQVGQSPSYSSAPAAHSVSGYTPVAPAQPDQQWSAPTDQDLPF